MAGHGLRPRGAIPDGDEGAGRARPDENQARSVREVAEEETRAEVIVLEAAVAARARPARASHHPRPRPAPDPARLPRFRDGPRGGG